MREWVKFERFPLALRAVVLTAALFGVIFLTPTGFWLPISWVVVGGVLILFWISRVAQRGSRSVLVVGALLGLTLRAVGAWLVVDDVIRYSDTGLYWYLGTRLADVWTSPGILDVDLVKVLGTSTTYGYYVWTALHVLLLRDQILTSLSNSLIGTATGVLTYLLARRVWDERVAVITAWLVWLSSAFIIIDAHSLRDSLATFTILATVYGTQRLTERFEVQGIVWFVLGFVGVVLMRTYLAFLLVPVGLASLLVMARGRRLPLLIGFTLGGAVAGALLVTSDAFRILTKLAEGNAIIDMIRAAHFGLVKTELSSSALAGVKLRTIQDMILFIPVGIVRILFAPLPWLPTRMDVMFIPDVIVRYAIMPLFFVGFWEAIRWHRQRTLLVALVLVAGMVLYSVIELGGGVRHSLQFFPYHYLFAAIGWTVAHRHPVLVWTSYGLVTLAVCTVGFTLMFSLLLFPIIFLVLVVWLCLYMILQVRFQGSSSA